MRYLPPLAFGEKHALKTSEADKAAKQASEAVTAIRNFTAKRDAEGFISKTANIFLPKLSIYANASSPLKAEMEASNDIYFSVTFYGDCVTWVDSKKFSWRPRDKAIFIGPSGHRLGESDYRSFIVAKLDRALLKETALAMCGSNVVAAESLDLTTTRVVDLNSHGMDISSVFESYCHIFDALKCREEAINSINLSDGFYRSVVASLMPHLLIEEIRNNHSDEFYSDRIEFLISEMRSCLHKTLTMTDLERLAGLSRRQLQIMFNKRFGFAPMEWQRRDRLRIARERLLNYRGDLSISEVAEQVGFASASRFSSYYKDIYGELPSETAGKYIKNK
jgi:AraC-like DNA-binding protein